MVSVEKVLFFHKIVYKLIDFTSFLSHKLKYLIDLHLFSEFPHPVKCSEERLVLSTNLQNVE